MAKLNCWEFKKCGREQKGARSADLGVCRANTEARVNGINGGRNGGRACWPLAGTLCGGAVQGTFAMKLGNCMKCDFYQLVVAEEGKEYQSSKEILKNLNRA